MMRGCWQLGSIFVSAYASCSVMLQRHVANYPRAARCGKHPALYCYVPGLGPRGLTVRRAAAVGILAGKHL